MVVFRQRRCWEEVSGGLEAMRPLDLMVQKRNCVLEWGGVSRSQPPVFQVYMYSGNPVANVWGGQG